MAIINILGQRTLFLPNSFLASLKASEGPLKSPAVAFLFGAKPLLWASPTV